jgi:pyruvate ferredoxin oxidoreductase beta subunit
MSRLKRIARNQNGVQPLGGGHALCQGCGAPAIVRTVLSSIETPVIVVNATGCLEVATSRYPITAWNVPWMHTAFENTAAVASGVEAAFKVLKRRGTLPGGDKDVTIVAFGGDGGTYDIGLQALSGALERGHRFLYVCYDNGAYMNTGIQRSGATPYGADTTTSPVGSASVGKLQQRKDLTAIAAAHHIPFVGQASGARWQDLSSKVERAVSMNGPAFLNVMSNCPLGWGHESRIGLDVMKAAQDSLFWPLFEVVNGEYKLSYRPRKVIPVVDFLKMQRRFAHLFKPGNEALLVAIQEQVENEWRKLLRLCDEPVTELPVVKPAEEAEQTEAPVGAVA